MDTNLISSVALLPIPPSSVQCHLIIVTMVVVLLFIVTMISNFTLSCTRALFWLGTTCPSAVPVSCVLLTIDSFGR